MAYQHIITPVEPIFPTSSSLSLTINLFYLLLGRAYRMSVLGIFNAPAIAVLTALSLLIGLYEMCIRDRLHRLWL